MIEPVLASWTEGLLADAANANLEGRLLAFIQDETSEPLQLFAPEIRATSESGDWYGEHAGKWLVAASLAFRRSGDPRLGQRIEMAVSFLKQCQEESGYLGTYAPSAQGRFTEHPGEGVRTWDLWTHAWLILGFLEAGEAEPARKIGDLLLQTFPADAPSLVSQGNHQGLSSLVLIEPLAHLTKATGDPRYLDLAVQAVEQAQARGLNVLAWADKPNYDPSQVGSGKIYQMLWVFRGLVAMHQLRPSLDYLVSVRRAWTVIRDHHLDPTGGPWGGIAAHKEVFNPSGFFSPRGLVETCSSATWMALTHDLYLLDGEASRLAEIEKTLLNSVLGAQGANGEDWIYFSFPNGRINHTYHWACCRASGTLAIEWAAEMAISKQGERLNLDLLVPCEAHGLRVSVGSELTLEAGEDPLEVTVRIPEWLEPGLWGAQERLTISIPAGESKTLPLNSPIRATKKTHTVDHHGQEIVREDYMAVACGPFAYAIEERDDRTFQLPFLDPRQAFRKVGDDTLELLEPGRAPVRLKRYFEAGDRRDGAYRTTWIPVEWQ